MELNEVIGKTGLTLQTLADKLGVSSTSLQKWKYGTRTPNPHKVDMIYYLAKEINAAAWHSGIIDYYNNTRDGAGTLRLLDIVREGIDSIQDTDYELVKALQPYLSDGSAMLVNDIIAQKSGKE